MFTLCSLALPDSDGREQHHGGDVVQEGREDGRNEAEDHDHGPHSSSGQLVGLSRWTGRSSTALKLMGVRRYSCKERAQTAVRPARETERNCLKAAGVRYNGCKERE